MRSRVVPLVVAAVCLARAAAPQSTGIERALDSIRAENLRADVYFFADDALEGRDTPSPGLRIAANFVRARLERLGFQPGAGDSFFQEYAVGVRRLDPERSSIVIGEGPDARRLAYEVEAGEQLDRSAELRLEHRVHHHDEPRLVAQPLLDDRLDRDALHSQDLGDSREHARPVRDLEVEVEGELRVGHERHVLRRRHERRRRDHRRDHVAEHGARRLDPAGSRAGQGDLGDGGRLDRDRVEGAVHRRERVVGVQERGVHVHGHAAARPLRGADQLQRQVELLGVLDVVGGEPLDALVAHLVEPHGGVEGEPGEDRHLGGGVLAGHVLGGVGLGVAQPLRLGQRLVVARPRARHLAEDVVGGAVDDSMDALDVGGGERLRHHADRRHHARHGALEAQLHAAAAGRVEDLLAVLGEQLLVGGHHVAAGVERPQHVLARGVDPAHELHDQVASLEDVVVVAAAACEHTRDLGAAADLGLDCVRPLVEQLGEGTADRAVAQKADAECAVRQAAGGARGAGLSITGHAASDLRRSRGGPPRARGHPCRR